MSTFIKPLDVQFANDDLNLLRNEITSFHVSHRLAILENFKPGNTPISPKLGYYIPYFEQTFKTRNVSSWSDMTDLDFETFSISTIKMTVDKDKGRYQNLYTVKPKRFFSADFDKIFNSILDKVPHEFQRESASFSVQEMGYSMKFHTDGGVKSRIHIVLNENGLDYFYTSDGPHKMEFGECCLFEASLSHHGFMSFSDTLRIHIILDVL